LSRNTERNLRLSQSSVFYYTQGLDDPVLKRTPDYSTDLYPSMLITDVQNEIMPYTLHKESSLSVYVSPSDQRTEELVTIALKRRNHASDLQSAVSDFLRECVQVIMTYGLAAYEVAYLVEKKTETEVGFRLSLVPPKALIHDGKLRQYVPPDIAEKLNVSQYIDLPRENVFLFEHPSFTASKITQMMNSLSLLSKAVPSLLLGGFSGTSGKPFDVGVPSPSLEKSVLAQVTRLIGWNARGLFNEEISEFYQFHRLLLFHKFVTELRNALLSKMNDSFRVAGGRLGFSVELRIEGLPTIQDLEEAISRLTAGGYPFGEFVTKFGA